MNNIRKMRTNWNRTARKADNQGAKNKPLIRLNPPYLEASVEPRKMTPEEFKLMKTISDRWISLAIANGKDVKREEVDEDIEWIYARLSLPKPLILIADSYYSQQLMINLLQRNFNSESQIESQIWSEIKSQIESQNGPQPKPQVLWQVERQIESLLKWHIRQQVDLQIGSNYWSRFKSQIRSGVEAQVELQTKVQVASLIELQFLQQLGSDFWLQNLDFIEQWHGLAYESWLSFIDYIREIGIEVGAEFEHWARLMTKGIWSIVFFDKVVFICKTPTKVLKEQNGRLHSTTEAAVQWMDGMNDYFIHGVGFDRNLWSKVIKKELSSKEILQLRNIEQRCIASSMYDPELLLALLEARLINKSERGNELYGISNIIPDRIVKYLKYTDPSTGRVYVCPVPFEMKKADQAMAWKFQLTPAEYKLLRVEA
jgi:uncharacterized protein DUF6745